mmetsp:Transcript_19188/g.35053  ORF Transcript_19188/g.35053 Transcript_19188/m.35053 type:complete len:318 (-) Transcript_19188:53-1006(-)
MEESNSRNRPKYKAYVQGKLKALQPMHSAASTVITLLLLSGILLTSGFNLMKNSEDLIEEKKRYDDVDECENEPLCEVTVNISDKMSEPVYVYYEMRNFYQNHMNYVSSRDNPQLRGEDRTKTEVKTCEPIKENGDLYTQVSWKNVELDSGDVANPCGLAAYTLFNDTFSLYRIEDSPKKYDNIEIDTDDIAWKSDVDYVYVRADKEEEQWLDVEDEHFMVWMRLSPLPTFRKLYGVVNEDLKEGAYNVTISNNYDVSKWDGEKHIVFATVSPIGGKTNALAAMCLAVGFLASLAALIFGIVACALRDKVGSQELKW